MPDQQFQKKKEDFLCEHCGEKVSGDGFTNHCPKCLWSKHVDIHPGDRAALCGGPMVPSDVVKEGESWKITHTCVVCGHQKNNKSEEGDSFEALLTVSQKKADEQSKEVGGV